MNWPPLPKNSGLEKALGCSVVHYKDAIEYGQACREHALEEAAMVAGPEDSYQDIWFEAKADAVRRIKELK